MTLCPYALVVGCEKCPILKVCPLKTVIGNQPDYSDGQQAKDSPSPNSESEKE